jgi:hypothetical protein
MNDYPDNIISAREVAEVEALYQRLITPLRCRLGWHRWEPWSYIMTVGMHAQHITTGRCSQRAEVDLEVRLCPACGKIVARAAHCRAVPPGEDEG